MHWVNQSDKLKRDRETRLKVTWLVRPKFVLPPDICLNFWTVPLTFYLFLKLLSRVLIQVFNFIWVYKTCESISCWFLFSHWLRIYSESSCRFLIPFSFLRILSKFLIVKWALYWLLKSEMDSLVCVWKAFSTFKRTVLRDFFYLVFPPNSSSWSH